jgi:hypothetical protein
VDEAVLCMEHRLLCELEGVKVRLDAVAEVDWLVL